MSARSAHTCWSYTVYASSCPLTQELKELRERLGELQAGQLVAPDWQEEEADRLRLLRLHLDRGLTRASQPPLLLSVVASIAAASSQNRTLMSVESETVLNASSLERLGKDFLPYSDICGFRSFFSYF